MTLAGVAREAAIGQILRYELYRHESLTERIRSIAPAAAQRRLDPRSHQATWQIIFYLCRCYYTGYRPTVTDVYLSAKISKVTAIKRLRDLDDLGILGLEPDAADRRRKHVLASTGLKRALELFVDDYVGDLRRMVGEVPGGETETVDPPSWPQPAPQGVVPMRRAAFLGDISHEIRIALNSILGFSDAIRSEILGQVAPQGYREYANDIYGAGRHLQALVNDLVDMAHAALTDVGSLNVDEVDAGEIVSDVVAASRETARHAGVDLAARVSSDLPTLQADGRRLSQVLLSIVGHAIRQNPVGGRVAIETEPLGDAVRFRVRNTGDGDGDAARPSAPPTPSQETRSGIAPGAKGRESQLGLVLSRSIVQTLGGELRFETGADGTATATIELPLAPPAGNGQGRTDGGRPPSSSDG